MWLSVQRCRNCGGFINASNVSLRVFKVTPLPCCAPPTVDWLERQLRQATEETDVLFWVFLEPVTLWVFKFSPGNTVQCSGTGDFNWLTHDQCSGSNHCLCTVAIKQFCPSVSVCKLPATQRLPSGFRVSLNVKKQQPSSHLTHFPFR